MSEYDARLGAAELQQWMTDEAIGSLTGRIASLADELAEVRRTHHAEMVTACAALDAATAEIERLRALLPPGV